MILICPGCAARFMIPDGALGASGRTVRCGACGHSWHQFPEPAAPRAAPPGPDSRGADSPGLGAGPGAAAPAAAAPGAAAPSAVAPSAVAVPHAEPPSVAPATREAAPAAASAAQLPAHTEIGADAPSAGKKKWGWGRRSDAKAEAATAEEPPPVPSLAVAGAADAAAREAAAADAEGARGRRGASRVLVWFLFVFVVATIVLGGYNYRQDVVRLWPPATRLYQVLGIAVDPPSGYWLRVPEDSIKFRREADSGTPILVVSGEILNQSEKPQRVAPMRILLLDKEGRILRTERVKIDDRTLDPGKRMPFQTSIPNSPPEAVAVRITFDVSG